MTVGVEHKNAVEQELAMLLERLAQHPGRHSILLVRLHRFMEQVEVLGEET